MKKRTEYLHPLYEDIARIGKALRTKNRRSMPCFRQNGVCAEAADYIFVEVSSDLAALSMEQWEVCRILGNLIDNAFTAVSGMDGEKKVHLCIQENEKQYLFIIYNNGPVIPENKRELIFKKGYSSKKGRRPRTGAVDGAEACRGSIEARLPLLPYREKQNLT